MCLLYLQATAFHFIINTRIQYLEFVLSFQGLTIQCNVSTVLYFGYDKYSKCLLSFTSQNYQLHIFNFYLGQRSSTDVSHILEDNLNMNKHNAPITNRCPLTTSLLRWNVAKVKRIGYQPLSEKSLKTFLEELRETTQKKTVEGIRCSIYL